MGESFENRDMTGTVFRRVNLGAALFNDVNLGGAVFDDVNLGGTTIRNANLADVSIDGANIRGMTIFGIRVGQLIDAELDRRDPERVRLRMSENLEGGYGMNVGAEAMRHLEQLCVGIGTRRESNAAA